MFVELVKSNTVRKLTNLIYYACPSFIRAFKFYGYFTFSTFHKMNKINVTA